MSDRQWNSTIKDLGDKIVGLTLMQAKELGDYLKDVHGIEAAAAPAMMAAMPGAGAGAAAAEKTTFDVVLETAGDKKIQVIKVVREITSLGLKEAKDLVDGAPKTVKEGLAKADAEKIKADLEAAGAKVALK